MITKTCEVCSSPFDVRNYRANTARFCSQICGGKWHMSARKMPSDHKIGNKFAAGSGPNAGSFKPGIKVWNDGMKGMHLSPDTEWKKGCTSMHILPTGSITVRIDKNGKPRAYVKIAEPSTWKQRSIAVWEGENGPLPKGMVVHHIDRDTLNDAIKNLEAHTRASHIQEHRADLVEAMNKAR